MENIVQEYTGLIYSIINNYKNCNVAKEDLFQEAVIGLLEAEKRFDPEKGNQFITYATYWIKKYVLKAIDNEFSHTSKNVDFDNRFMEQASGKSNSQSVNLPSFPDKMPDIEKKIIVLSYFDEYTLNEIAEILDISRERVRQIRQKAIRRLKASGFFEKWEEKKRKIAENFHDT
jgi:RNA polymerase primary sigma factor